MSGKISRFDLILIIDATLAVCFIAQECWLRANGYGDLPSGAWSFLISVFGVETVTFSLYQMVKEVNRNSNVKLSDVPKSVLSKHANIKEMEDAYVRGNNTGASGQSHSDVPNIS